MNTPLTKGSHHIGLTVSNLEESAGFFTTLLGWKEVRRDEEYPAIFVSDGSIMLTLWATKEEPVNSFNKNSNVGLHHIAFHVDNENDLNAIHKKLVDNGIIQNINQGSHCLWYLPDHEGCPVHTKNSF